MIVGFHPAVRRPIKRGVFWIVDVGGESASYTQKKVMFHAMGGSPEMQSFGPDRLGEITP